MKESRFLYLLIIAIGVLLLNGCKYSDKPKSFSNGTISVEYPSYLKEDKSIYPANSLLLGVKNAYRNVFFVLVDNGQKSDENDFSIKFDSLSTQLKRGIREPFVEKDSSFTLNGFKVREMHISGILASMGQEKRMYFILNLFEDKNGHLYQTTGWCFRHRRDLWQKDLLNIAYSLKE